MAKKQNIDVDPCHKPCAVQPRNKRRPTSEPGVTNILLPWFATGKEMTIGDSVPTEVDMGDGVDVNISVTGNDAQGWNWVEPEDVLSDDGVAAWIGEELCDESIERTPIELDVIDRFYAGTADFADSVVAISRIAGMTVNDVIDELVAKGIDLLWPKVEEEDDDPITAVHVLTNRDFRGVSLPSRRPSYAHA